MSDIYGHPFQRTDRIFGDIEILRANRAPCMVCGHPTGDCSDGNLVKPDHILGDDLNFESLKDEKMFLVEEDVYEDRERTAFTSARVLVHRTGSYVTRARAIELGILKI